MLLNVTYSWYYTIAHVYSIVIYVINVYKCSIMLRLVLLFLTYVLFLRVRYGLPLCVSRMLHDSLNFLVLIRRLFFPGS